MIDNALRNNSWEDLLSSLEKQLSSWNFWVLNLPSRIILLKLVLQAIPLYIFHVLATPRIVLKKVRAIQRNFLWSGVRGEIKWVLIKWSDICKPKNAGILGLRDPAIMNQVPSVKPSGDGSNDLLTVGKNSGEPSI